MVGSIEIATLQDPAHFRVCERLQEVIWQADPVEIVPAHLLITAQRHGGLVLGAFAAGEMVGFLFGFAGQVAEDNPAAAGGGLWQHCSHIMGVLPGWQGRGVGYRLKLAQRDWALAQGYDLVTWTYDPLEAGNGVLNLGKLGAICRCYLRDFYGQMADGLNVGIPTDRFEVSWWVGSERVRRRLESGWTPPRMADLAGAVVLNPARAAGGWLEPGPLQPLAGNRLLVEVPARFQALKAASLELARAWRLSLRGACEAAFGAGYAAVDVVRAEGQGVPRVYYVLEQEG
jgi:predicted GNAT superfamily acetyltransferase